jgi:hypothetical protein
MLCVRAARRVSNILPQQQQQQQQLTHKRCHYIKLPELTNKEEGSKFFGPCIEICKRSGLHQSTLFHHALARGAPTAESKLAKTPDWGSFRRD